MAKIDHIIERHTGQKALYIVYYDTGVVKRYNYYDYGSIPKSVTNFLGSCDFRETENGNWIDREYRKGWE